MKVYEYRGFPNPTRVRIALAEKGLLEQVDFVHIDVPAGAHKTPEFLAKNPSGAVPVLELADGTLISECSAIIDYLDLLTGETALTGKGARDRALITMMQRKIEAGLLDAVAAYFHYATPGLGPDIETYTNAGWGRHQRERAIASMHWLDGVLAIQPFMAGERFTVADITAVAGLAYADFVELAVPEACENLAAWRQRVGARPSAAAA